MSDVFVFGSNEAGRHGAGSALAARIHWGAVWGHGEGRQGQSYAIPTKDRSMRVLPLWVIQASVLRFLVYAAEHPAETFRVVKIGCGLAGYTEAEIAPMFAGAPVNVELPHGWDGVPYVIYASPEAHARLVELLDNPPEPNEGLRRLFAKGDPDATGSR